jgi:predicted amidophosphoribosyltransferase
MSDECCPHCGSKLPLVVDAFCGTCGESLDEPPEEDRSPEDQAAFRARVEQQTKDSFRLLRRLMGLFHWF